MEELINGEEVDHGTLVWREGLTNWTTVAETGLARYLSGPPPLTGDSVGNAWVWWLAFAPLLGMWLQYFIAGAVNANDNSESSWVSWTLVSCGWAEGKPIDT